MTSIANQILEPDVTAVSQLPDYSGRAKMIIGSYIKSAILIDDYWPAYNERGEILVATDDISGTEVEADVEFCEEEVLSETGAALKTAMPIVATNNASDVAVRLLKIQDCFTKKGIICTGFKYTDQEKQFAPILAKNADIVILDWNFAGDKGVGAVEILKELKDGQLRFICIFTDDPNLITIKKRILEDVCSTTFDDKNNETDFKVENFVFTLRNKTIKNETSANESSEEKLLDDAISHLSVHYHGFLQLAMLEMTSQHRNTLLTHLVKFSSEYDAALLSEAALADSPLNLPSNLRALLIDEWKIALDSADADRCLLGESGRTAYAASLKVNSPKISMEFLNACVTALGLKPPVDEMNRFFGVPLGQTQRKFDCDIGKWLDDGAISPAPSYRELKAKEAAKMTVATLYALSHADSLDQNPTQEAIYNHVFRLDALFNQQQLLPKELTQGTILKFDDENYLICITPLCDAARYKEGFYAYSFLGATRASSEKMLAQANDYCVFLEKGKPVCLHVDIKSPYVYEIGHEARVISLGKLVAMRPRRLPSGKPLQTSSEGASFVSEKEGSVTVLISVDGAPDSKVVSDSIDGETMTESVPRNADGTFSLTVVGQLRTDFFLMLTAASASNSVRVGVNRMEFIRSHKN